LTKPDQYAGKEKVMKTAVIIGGTGLLGSAICKELAQRGYHLDEKWLSDSRPDVRDPDAFKHMPAKIDLALYLAGINVVEPA
jgi:uncharacterized protein YbjT (DUF2867 family)